MPILQQPAAAKIARLKKALVVASLFLAVAGSIMLSTQGYRYFRFGGRSLAWEMKTSEEGYGQVYFDTGRSYEENNSHCFSLRPTRRFERYRVPVPATEVIATRFDPLNKKGLFEIRSIAIETPDHRTVWGKARLVQCIVPMQQIEPEDATSTFVGRSTGDDPNFYLAGLAIVENPHALARTLGSIAALIGLTVLTNALFFLIVVPLLQAGYHHKLKEKLAPGLEKIQALGESRYVRYAGLALLLVLWGRVVASIYWDTGLFAWLGTDFALYYAQSQALWAGDPGAIYRPEVFDGAFQELLGRYSFNHERIDPTHVPYLPLFPWLFTPFAAVSPSVGFFLWEGMNLLALAYLAWRVIRLFPGMGKVGAAAALFASFPVVYCLIVGQIQLLLACAVAESYFALRRGRDFRGGLWLAVLLFKPQYGILLGMLLLWKCRWKAICGAAVGGIALVGGSVWAAGAQTLLDYPSAMIDMARFSFDDITHMVNWHFLILSFWPGIGERESTLLSHGFAIATLICTALAWRGAWLPRLAHFPAQFALALTATLLASPHSFNYGASILVAPLAAALAEKPPDGFFRSSVAAAILLPTLSFTLVNFRDVPWATLILTLSLVAVYVSLWRQLGRCHRGAPAMPRPRGSLQRIPPIVPGGK